MPSTELRQKLFPSARRVVIKLGTAVLSQPDGTLDLAYIRDIARQIVALRERRIEVTIVSSGAVGAGCAVMKLTKRPTDVATLQAVAAVGQRQLMTHMHEAFAPYGLHVGQLLLTRTDFDDRTRYLNIRNCVTRLHEMSCIPVINENDTVAVDELRFGDNDTLAALMCNALGGQVLVVLSVVDGLLDENGQVIDLMHNSFDAAPYIRQEKTAMGSGGMTTKLEATRLVTEAGEAAVIANGRTPDVLLRLFAGESGIGTVFVPAHRKMGSRQRWIALTARPAGIISIDEGAVHALVKRNKSLLATGITETTGNFSRGEIVVVRDPHGREIARGLTNYASEELRLIMGKRSNQFEKLLGGRTAYAEVIHRDNMVVVAREDASGRTSSTVAS